MKLTIELVPESCWYSNVRSEITRSAWDVIRAEIYKAADYKCEICGGVGSRHPVECHEIWHYDDKKHVQTLKGFTALCPKCHEVKHIGLAQVRDRYDVALLHFCEVNKVSKTEAERYVHNVFQTWSKRSQHKYTLDISILAKMLGREK